jgi:hypothetical protein
MALGSLLSFFCVFIVYLAKIHFRSVLQRKAGVAVQIGEGLQIHRVSPLGSKHVVEPILFTLQHIVYIFNIVDAPHLTALHEL